MVASTGKFCGPVRKPKLMPQILKAVRRQAGTEVLRQSQRIYRRGRTPILQRSCDDFEFDSNVVTHDLRSGHPIHDVFRDILDRRCADQIGILDPVYSPGRRLYGLGRLYQPVAAPIGQLKAIQFDDGEFDDFGR